MTNATDAAFIARNEKIEKLIEEKIALVKERDRLRADNEYLRTFIYTKWPEAKPTVIEQTTVKER